MVENDGSIDASLKTSNGQSSDNWRYRLSYFRSDMKMATFQRKRPSITVMKGSCLKLSFVHCFAGMVQNLSDVLDRLNSKTEIIQNKLDALINLAKILKNTKIEQFQTVKEILNS